MKKSRLIFSVLLVPVDFVMLFFAGLTTYLLRTKILNVFRPVLFEFNLPIERYLLLVLGMSTVFLIVYAISGLYSLQPRRIFEEFLRILVASSAGIMVVIVYIFLRQELFDSRFLVLGSWFFAVLFVMLGRLLARHLQKYFISKYHVGVNKVMVIGGDHVSNRIVREIKNNPASGYQIVKQLVNPSVEEIRLAIGNPGIDEVILADINYPAEKVVKLVDFCHENHLVFKFVPNLYHTLTTNYSFDTFSGLPLVELRRTALDGWGKVIKRLIDISGSMIGLIIFSPLFAIIALMVKWETAGPVFVRLRRVSQSKEFYLYKFRSMIKNAEKLKPKLFNLNEREDGPLFKIKNDPRVTKMGRFLRKYRIDELPQLVNVLGGDISLVGPRPHQPDEVLKYQKHHKKVLGIKAGATGMAQVSGSSDLPFEQEVNLDTYYIENWSLWLDFKIIIKTVLKVLFDRSAA